MKVRVKRVKMERPNEDFCSVFRCLYLVERLLFMTESVQFGFVSQFSFYKAMHLIPIDDNTFSMPA